MGGAALRDLPRGDDADPEDREPEPRGRRRARPRDFGIPGLGLRALNAVSQSDLPVIEATTLISALIIVVTNLLVDLFYSVLDPRVRLT